jgi:preprotein translocase subunit SecG
MIDTISKNILIIVAIGINVLILMQNPKRMDLAKTLETREKATWLLSVIFLVTYTIIKI